MQQDTSQFNPNTDVPLLSVLRWPHQHPHKKGLLMHCCLCGRQLSQNYECSNCEAEDWNALFASRTGQKERRPRKKTLSMNDFRETVSLRMQKQKT